MQDFVENVRGISEDEIMEGLYQQFKEKEVDAFIKGREDELITPEILQVIEELYDLVEERITELIDEKENSDEDEE
jgi:hypothetical protein